MGNMDVTDYTIKRIIFSGWIDLQSSNSRKTVRNKTDILRLSVRRTTRVLFRTPAKIDLWNPMRQWLDRLEIRNPQLAHRICKSIPSQCPFARQIKIFGHTLMTIPPLCKINPLYNELMFLRFRAISYLADECGEDVSAYC